VALFLAADGRCAECGVRLEPGWHADHVQPHIRGGATEAANGQALCPACNLSKGVRPA
jgi:5-methylcytosine-specific restriction endonuclease McrA